MADKITSLVATLIALGVAAAIGGIIVLVALAATGTVADRQGCRSDQVDPAGAAQARGVNVEQVLSEAWQGKWNAFNAQLDAGQPASMDFTESETSSRASKYLESKDTPVENLVICFHEGEAEAKGDVDLPLLGDLPGIGDAFNSSVRVRGTIDMSGPNPKIVVREIDAGNLPQEAAERLKGEIESTINDRLLSLKNKHKYDVQFKEGTVTVVGTP